MGREYNLAPFIHCGIELELERVELTSNQREDITRLGFDVTSDASVECKRPSYSDILIVTNSATFADLDMKNVGCEIVSKPFFTGNDAYKENIRRLCKIVQEESFVLPSVRSSVHVHCSFPRDYIAYDLINILRWGRALEGAIFRVASFLGDHRGKDNDYNYCRPITRKGPQVVNVPDGMAQIFCIDDVLELSKLDPSLTDFWNVFGDCVAHRDNKYHPIRYSWLNVFSILMHGTLEIRAFNQTLNATDILAAIGLTQAFTHAACTIPFEDTGLPEEDSLFEPSDSSKSLEYILNEYKLLSPDTVRRIMYLYDYGHSTRIEDVYVLSHMNEKKPMSYFQGDYCPTVLEGVELKKPEYKDKHNIIIEEIPDYDLLRKGASSRKCAN